MGFLEYTNHALVTIIKHWPRWLCLWSFPGFSQRLWQHRQKYCYRKNQKWLNYVIRGPAINWFKFHLRGRSQFITVHIESSNNLPLKCSVRIIAFLNYKWKISPPFSKLDVLEPTTTGENLHTPNLIRFGTVGAQKLFTFNFIILDIFCKTN